MDINKCKIMRLLEKSLGKKPGNLVWEMFLDETARE
jgi:hypothetical protein